jgi:general secretion pathway protein C
MKKLSAQQRSHIQKWALYGLLLFIGFTVADLTILYVRESFIPQAAPPKKIPQQQSGGFVDRSQYSAITNRNLFSSSGNIPDALAALNQAKEDGEPKEDIPVQSSLPLNLVGTLVHTDPSKSVAAIEVKSKNMSGSYMVGAEIENMAKIEKVERGIVYFRNLNNGALEYIEIAKGNTKVNFDSSKASPPVKAGGKEIQAIGNNTFRVKRADLNKYLNDLSGLLMQARALPNRDPNTGEINGYRLVDYQPGSIFEQMGLPRGTLIKSAGGEPVNSIQSAMEMFNKLKKENKVKLGVEVNGSDQEFNYEIQ